MRSATKATLVHRGGRTFKVERAPIGFSGWVVHERGLEPGTTWSAVSGAHRTKGDAYRDINRMVSDAITG